MSALLENIDLIASMVYNETGGDDMRAADVIQTVLKERGKTQKSLAEQMGFSPQNFSKKLVNDTLSAKDFFAVIDALGLTISFHDKITGEEVKERRPGILPRVSMVVDGIRYDTHKADALCHTEEHNGWKMELYKDYRGRYFIVHWTDWENVKPSISPCDKTNALRLYEAYRDIDDPPPDVMFGNPSG